MIILDLEQRSQEWFKARCGKVTASGFSKVMAKGQGKIRKSYIYKLLAERISGISTENSFTSPSLERGTVKEDEARANYSLERGLTIQEVGFVEYDENIGCSPDGLIYGRGHKLKGGIEIKCPDSHTHVEYLLNGFPSVYKVQVQGNMWICGSDWWDFISYDDRVKGKELYIERILRDDEYIENLENEVNLFVKEMIMYESRLGGLDNQLKESIKKLK